MHIIAGNGRLHLLFQAALYRGIQSQNHTVSAPGGNIILVRKGHIHFIVALGGNHPPRASGEEAVVGGLHPLHAIPSGIGKADDLGRQGAHGIHPLGSRLQVDTGDVVLADVLPDCRPGIPVNTGTHLPVALAEIHCLLRDPTRFLTQKLPQK